MHLSFIFSKKLSFSRIFPLKFRQKLTHYVNSVKQPFAIYPSIGHNLFSNKENPTKTQTGSIPVIRNIRIFRNRGRFGVPSPADNIKLLLRQQRHYPVDNIRLCLCFDISNGALMENMYRYVSSGHKHCTDENLIHGVTYVCKH